MSSAYLDADAVIAHSDAVIDRSVVAAIADDAVAASKLRTIADVASKLRTVTAAASKLRTAAAAAGADHLDAADDDAAAADDADDAAADDDAAAADDADDAAAAEESFPEIIDPDHLWKSLKGHKDVVAQASVLIYNAFLLAAEQAAKCIVRDGKDYAFVYTGGWSDGKGQCLKLYSPIDVNLTNHAGKYLHCTVDRVINGNATTTLISRGSTRMDKGHRVTTRDQYALNYAKRDKETWEKARWIELLNTQLSTPIKCNPNITPLELAIQQLAIHDWILTDTSNPEKGSQLRLELRDARSIVEKTE